MTNKITLEFTGNALDWWSSLNDADKTAIVVTAYCKEHNIMIE